MPGPSAIRHRRPEHGLGHSSLSVLLPSITHPSGGTAEGEAVRQHIPGHSPPLASPVMVPRLNQSFRGSSPVPLTAGRSSGSGPSQEVLGSPQPVFVPIPCLTGVREHPCDETCNRFRADGGLVTLITEPGFLAKNQKPQLCLAQGSAHNVRKFSASWAAFNSAPFNEIMQAA